MRRREFLSGGLMGGGALLAEQRKSHGREANAWLPEGPLLGPGPPGAFDQTAVKDPSLVFFEGHWHVFYTARGNNEYTTGYVSAPELAGLRHETRHELKRIRGRNSRYACAPQVLFLAPQGLWYLLFQTRDANYQAAFSTTRTIGDPDSWSDPVFLLQQEGTSKWIDFWIICDDRRAHLFYTQDHEDAVVRTAALETFPSGWGAPSKVFSGVHEAVHVYKVKGRREYHMICELNLGERTFGLARSRALAGPWEKVTDHYATGSQLSWPGRPRWTDVVSHGRAVRAGYDQRLEYDAENPRLMIQGVRKPDYREPYPEIPWALGMINRK